MSGLGTNMKGFTLIKMPEKMKTQIKNFEQLKKTKEAQNIAKIRTRGNIKCPVIVCKDSKLNFFKGQTYSKFDKVPLASRGWMSRKSKGDYFSIQKHGLNPALLNSDEENEFSDLGLDPRIVESLSKCGFETPTEIQRMSIPHILEGSNTLIAAETGNGKTLSFLAPLLSETLRQKKQCPDDALNSPTSLIIVPGRELVLQIRDLARRIGSDLGISINSVVGGRTKRMMLRPRLAKPDILVGSFGTLSKLTTNQIYKIHRVNHLVLDEVDTLLDDSFNESTTHFISKFPIKGKINDEMDHLSGTQLTLVGATFPRSIHTILDKVVDIDSLTYLKTSHLHRVSPHVTQTFVRVGHDERAEKLLRFVKRNHKAKIPTLVFSNSSKCAFWVSEFLEGNGIPCSCVCGSFKSYDRMHRFETFQNEDVNVISCTDLVSRGLDTVRAKHVLNFEFPKYVSDYIHRSGRVGRVGGEDDCQVTSFIYSKKEVELVQKIEYSVRKSEELPQVNANIKRLIQVKKERHELRLMMEEEED